ncbi:hypothetical protein LXA43DRAFT_383863 [Ganoderma leucocontextum]|nr:hypothetical protein LXA43DRAFT_383863 [Ganoderma leucocontextum]
MTPWLSYKTACAQQVMVPGSSTISLAVTMPPSASLSPAAIIAEYSTLTNLNYCGIAGFVLILHDYLVTFRQEVNMFWTRKLNGAAILFYLNRYSFITVYAIYQLSTYAPISEQVCPSESRLAFGIRAVAYAVWAVFAGLRAYALSWNWPLGLFVLLLQSVPIGINLSLFHFGVTGIPLPSIGCELSDFVTKTLSRRCDCVSELCYHGRLHSHLHYMVHASKKARGQHGRPQNDVLECSLA